MRAKHDAVPEFSILGGPLQRLGIRLGLIRGKSDTSRMGIALGLGAWVVLVLLALMQGFGPKLWSMAAIGVHVRFLVVIPLFFLCEVWVGPQMAEFIRHVVDSGLVPKASLPAMAADIRRIGRLKDSSLIEGLLLLIAFAAPLLETVVPMPGKTGSWTSVLNSSGGLTWLNGWYLGLCLPLFRFLILRWLWRLALWAHFLWRFQKLDLRLLAIHSDGVAGLGYLELVHENFSPLIVAISALYAALFAEGISTGSMVFEDLYSFVPMVTVLMGVLCVGPLVIFAPKLWVCRWTGMSHYMGLASRYVNAFDSKWVQGGESPQEDLLGTPDLQSLADLTNSVDMVRTMRLIPVGRKLLLALVGSVLAPMLPLLLMKFPVDQLLALLFRALTGM
jgi:hypothetical protein